MRFLRMRQYTPSWGTFRTYRHTWILNIVYNTLDAWIILEIEFHRQALIVDLLYSVRASASILMLQTHL